MGRIDKHIHYLMQSSAKTVTAYLKEVPAERIDFDMVESMLRTSAGSTGPVC